MWHMSLHRVHMRILGTGKIIKGHQSESLHQAVKPILPQTNVLKEEGENLSFSHLRIVKKMRITPDAKLCSLNSVAKKPTRQNTDNATQIVLSYDSTED